MSPKELPRQRLHEVVALPERPAAFDVVVFDGRLPSGLRIPRKPSSPELIVHCEWAWSPMHSRVRHQRF